VLESSFTLPEEIQLEPKVYYRLTDNWVELSVRFIVPQRGVRAIKDSMNREILNALEEAKIEIASGTYEIVGLPPIRFDRTPEGPFPDTGTL
jgi:hypothetical protein